MPEAFRVDRGSMGQARIDANGFLIAKGVFTRTGVFTYKHIDEQGKTFVTRELRHPDDVYHPDSIASLVQVPVCDDHPSEGRVTPENARRLSVGNVGDSIETDGKFVKGVVNIRDDSAIAKVTGRGGKKPKLELSCGYKAEVVDESGEYNGERYDCRQTNIRYNHVAIVRKGRAGADARLLLDAADAVCDEEWEEEHEDGTTGADQDTDSVVPRIGRTMTGKPIYVNAEHPDHEHFRKSDHEDAMAAHARRRDSAGMAGDYFRYQFHGADTSSARQAAKLADEQFQHHADQIRKHQAAKEKAREDADDKQSQLSAKIKKVAKKKDEEDGPARVTRRIVMSTQHQSQGGRHA